MDNEVMQLSPLRLNIYAGIVCGGWIRDSSLYGWSVLDQEGLLQGCTTSGAQNEKPKGPVTLTSSPAKDRG